MINLTALKSGLKIFQVNKKTNKTKPNFYIKNNNLKPLSKDIFTFTGNTKLNRSLMDAFDNKSICEEVRENAKEATNDLEALLKGALEKYTDNKDTKGRPIHHIEIRRKSARSIREKTANILGDAILSNYKTTFNPKNPKDIKKNCQDIIGARLVLGTTDNNSVLKVINEIIKLINNNKLKVTRIESYQPEGEFENLAYVKPEDLQRIKEAADKIRAKEGKGPVEIVINNKSSGYMAVHLDLDLSNPDKYVSNKDGFSGEIQIVGKDVSNLKEVEDFCYKLNGNKEIKSGNVAYKPFSEYFLRYINLNDKVKDYFKEYTSRAYLIQRQKEPVIQEKRIKKVILPTIEECGMQGKVPPELDFNTLYKIKRCCDGTYKYTEIMN